MKHILCYGDSNTWGHNPQPEGINFRYADDVRWPGVLQKLLGNEVKVIEEGLCGRTVMYDDPSAPYRNGKTHLGCILQSHIPLDLVILMLGTNDIRHIFTPCVREIAMGMANLVRIVQMDGTFDPSHVPHILVIAPPPVRDEIATSDFYGMYDEESVRKSKLLADEYHKMFQDWKGVSFLDAGKVGEVSIHDCIHLTREGHQTLAEAVAEKVIDLLALSR